MIHAMTIITLVLCATSLPTLAQSTVYQRDTLVPPNPTSDPFGQSVAFDGSTLVVGASDEWEGSATDSDAHFYQRQGVGWSQPQQIIGPQGESFGFSVSVDGNYAVVSSVDSPPNSAGKVYIYKYISDGSGGMAWQLDTTFTSPNPQMHFGYSTAILDDTLAIGEIGDSTTSDGGSVHLYQHNGSNWVFDETIVATPSAGSLIRFGHDVDLAYTTSGEMILVASDIYNYSSDGSVYVFERAMTGGSVTTWSQTAEIINSTGINFFGTSIDTNGELLSVGTNNRKAWVYRYDSNANPPAWNIEATFSDPASGTTYYGESVAVLDDRILVGSDQRSFPSTRSGVIYEYLYNGSTWSTSPSKYYAFESVTIDNTTYSPTNRYLGHSIAVHNNTFVSGAWGGGGHTLGLVAVFNVTTCSAADINDDGRLNFFDVSEFLMLYQNMDLAADFNGDGMLNFFDVSAFLISYQNGCS